MVQAGNIKSWVLTGVNKDLLFYIYCYNEGDLKGIERKIDQKKKSVLRSGCLNKKKQYRTKNKNTN